MPIILSILEKSRRWSTAKRLVGCARYSGFTCTRASFMAAQLETLHAHSSTRYGLVWPLDWPYSVSASHWFSSLEQLEQRKNKPSAQLNLLWTHASQQSNSKHAKFHKLTFGRITESSMALGVESVILGQGLRECLAVQQRAKTGQLPLI